MLVLPVSSRCISLPTSRTTLSCLLSQKSVAHRLRRMSSSALSRSSNMKVIETLGELRDWRNDAFNSGKTVGLIPTMGALHEGHLSLVRRSLEDNDLTVVSIFVNPAQFAPHEDFASYPRMLQQDLDALSALVSSSPVRRTTSAVFVPSVDTMYPHTPTSATSSINYAETGTLVEVKGLSSVLEGRSRPTFFRGVATVVTKLFNAVLPTHAYFGQKDIQQALVVRRMVRDLLMRYPSPETLHVVPTVRDRPDATQAAAADGDGGDEGLALSSRNAYLSQPERIHAPSLSRALRYAQHLWDSGATRSACVRGALDVLQTETLAATENGVHMKIDYIEMNDPWTLDPVADEETKSSFSLSDSDPGSGEKGSGQPVVLSGAVWVGKTRLIDNIILGDSSKILY